MNFTYVKYEYYMNTYKLRWCVAVYILCEQQTGTLANLIN